MNVGTHGFGKRPQTSRQKKRHPVKGKPTYVPRKRKSLDVAVIILFIFVILVVWIFKQ